jgi:hypothetical protein
MARATVLVLVLVGLATGCGEPAAAGDAGVGVDAAVELPLEAWSWVALPSMRCGDGSTTGYAINPTTRSSRLALLFEGGGACWEAAACYGILIPVTAVHLDGFDADTFAGRRPLLSGSWLLQRDDPTSPLGDATWVFVPYCTGDLHAGTQATVYDVLGQPRTMHHVGAHNLDALLAQLAPRAPSEVFAVGISAGGYGAQLAWDRIAAAFPDATTHVLADGAQLVPVEASRWGALRQRWAPRFPAGCADCALGFDRVAAHWRGGTPAGGGRFGVTASLRDPTLSLFFGHDAGTMSTASLAVAGAMTGSQAAFMIDDATHTMLAAPRTRTSTGVELRGWVEAWARGGAAFSTVGP